MRRIPRVAIAAVALATESAINRGGLTGFAHGVSERRVLLSATITASAPPIAPFTSLRLVGVP